MAGVRCLWCDAWILLCTTLGSELPFNDFLPLPILPSGLHFHSITASVLKFSLLLTNNLLQVVKPKSTSYMSIILSSSTHVSPILDDGGLGTIPS